MNIVYNQVLQNFNLVKPSKYYIRVFTSSQNSLGAKTTCKVQMFKASFIYITHSRPATKRSYIKNQTKQKKNVTQFLYKMGKQGSIIFLTQRILRNRNLGPEQDTNPQSSKSIILDPWYHDVTFTLGNLCPSGFDNIAQRIYWIQREATEYISCECMGEILFFNYNSTPLGCNWFISKNLSKISKFCPCLKI